VQHEIIIAAGEAFGSGAHLSTALSLEILAGVLQARPATRLVLDVGAGSGILSIAAALWGEDVAVVASDIHPQSTQFIRHNAELNGMEDSITPVRADGVEHALITAHAPYDVVMCNISLEAILPMLSAFASLIQPEGLLILSGIQRHQHDIICNAIVSAGLTVVTLLAREDWCAILAKHET
jgi:ribosomal protein L11 methyltransferase